MFAKLLKKLQKNKVFAVFLLFWSFYFVIFWSRAITIDQNGNVTAGLVNIWGDWAAHFTMGSAMAERSLFLTNSPFLINAKFSYPFVVNLISAVLIRIGVGFFQAFVIPSLIFSIACTALLFKFYEQIFKSVKVAVIGSLIFLFNGGWGIYYFFKDLFSSINPVEVLINPPQTYTNIEPELIRWISVIDSQIIPQRAFALGFPLTLLALLMVHRSFVEKTKRSGKVIFAAVILGLMPIIHAHSFLAAAVILADWMMVDLKNSKKLKEWLKFATVTAIISLPLIIFYLSSNTAEGFVRWHPGWYSFSHDISFLKFWLINWGVTPLVGIVGLWMIKTQKKKSNREKLLITLAPFWAIFILINLFLFQPFIWDNTKLLAWASVGISGLAGYAIVNLWSRNQRISKLVVRPILAIVFVSMTMAGALDAWRVLRIDLHSYQMYSSQELEMVKWVKQNTDPNSIWLTGDQHNSWLFNLTGRQPLMAYRGWLWTHGYDYKVVENDVMSMFKQPLVNQNLFEKYGVDFILIGPNEREVWNANESEFIENFELINSSENYLIFKTD